MPPKADSKKAAPAGNSAGNGDKFGKFVVCNLSDEDKVSVKAHLYEDAGVVGFLEACIHDGYKVSVSWDERSDCCAVFMTCTRQGSEDVGWTLSARGPDVCKAITVLAYKHIELLAGGWKEGKTAQNRDAWG